MGGRIRDFDWAATPLGPIDGWPSPLKTLVGVMLGSNQPMFVVWGRDRTLVYNDSYAQVLADKHPALGRDFLEVWSEVRADLGPLVERAYRGEALHGSDIELVLRRRGYPERTYWAYSYTPVHDEVGGVGGFFCPCHEITDQVLTERRQRFLVEVGQALSRSSGPREATLAAVTLLGRHLRASRVGYGEVQADDETVVLHSCYADGVAPLDGSYRLDSFGPEDIERQRRGRTQWCDDLTADPTQDPATWEAIETRSYASVPLVRDGRFVASLYVNFREPHAWTPHEIALIEEVAARTWGEVERAGAQARLRESEERFRNLADHAPVMMWVTDPSGSCTYLNRSWYAFTGQRPEEAEGFGWLEATHPDDRAQAERTFREANAVQKPFRLEYRLLRHDGTYRWAIDAAAPRFGPTGAFLGYVGSVIDIDERRGMEMALRENEERLRLAAHAAQIGTWDFDLVSGRGHWDEAALRIGGLSGDPGGYDATTWLRLVHPDDRPGVQRTFLASLDEGGPVYDVEFRGAVPADDGGTRWLTSHGAVIRDPATGRPARAIGIIRDATSRHRQQERLRESEARLRTITNAVPAFVWFATPDGDLHYFNDRWYEYTGQTAEEALPRGWTRFLHPEDVEKTADAWADARARGVTYEIEVRYLRRDGVYRWYVARAEPLRNERSEITLWFGTSTDIHDQKLAIERLELALDSGAILGTWVWDVGADIVTADERFAYTYSIDPAEARVGFPVARAVEAIHEDDRDRVREAIATAMAGDGLYRCEYRARNREGRYRWVEASGRVEFSPDGAPFRFAGIAVDIEGRRALEAERDRATSLLRAFFETLPGAAYAKNRDGRLILGNAGFCAAVGHAPDSFLGKTDLELLADEAQARAIMENDREVMEGGVTRQVEEDLVLPDGQLSQWLSVKTPLRDADGTIAGLVGISIDMTERRAAEERMRLLAREVDHRAKNLLAVAQSIVQLTRGGDVAAFKQAVTGRIQALARVHSLLAESRWEGVDLDALVRDELAPFVKPDGDRVRISGSPLRLGPSASQSLALTLHELVTNSAKYGSLSAEEGRLLVTWDLAGPSDGRWLDLTWEERDGPPVTQPTRAGFGSTVIRVSVERQLGGKLTYEWDPAGLRCHIRVPAAQLGTAADMEHYQVID